MLKVAPVKIARRPKTRRKIEDQRLMMALTNHISKDIGGMTVEELSILNDHAKSIKVSDDIAERLCKEVSPENPRAMKLFLQDFSRWVQQQKIGNKRAPVSRKR